MQSGLRFFVFGSQYNLVSGYKLHKQLTTSQTSMSSDTALHNPVGSYDKPLEPGHKIHPR